MRRPGLLIAILVLVSFTTPCAAILNVPTDYPDLQTALSSIKPCDTIMLDSGAYSSAGFREIYFTDTHCVTLMSRHGASSTQIDLAQTYFCTSEPYAGYAPHLISISGIHFRNGRPAIRLNYDSELAIFNCIFSDCTVAVEAGDFAGSTVGGIWNCDFRNNDTAIYGAGDPWLTMGYCLFENNFNAIVGGSAPWYDIYNCTIINNDYAGYLVYGQNRSALENNIFWGNSFGVLTYGPPEYFTNQLSCNDIFGNKWENYGGLPDQTGISGNVSVDPKYCDTTLHQFTLASISPLLPGNNSCGQLIGHFSTISCYCGDVDVSGNLDIADVTALISYLYLGGSPPVPLEAGEIDHNPNIDIGDLTYLIGYLYISGPPPPCGG